MKQWYYVDTERSRQGPVSRGTLAGRLSAGELPPVTLVWTEGMAEWTRADQVEGLIPEVEPPPIPATDDHRSLADQADKPWTSGPQVRPWVRYWARLIDVSLFSFVAGVSLVLLYPPAMEWHPTLLGLVVLMSYVFVETRILSWWGTTPGKALLCTRLRHESGSRPRYSQVLGRSLQVWIVGLAMGIPLLTLITMLIAYLDLTKNGATSWDRNGGFRIEHQTVGPVRSAAAALIVLSFAILMFYGMQGS